MVGGAARSSIWPQIVADVTGVPIALTLYDQWPALGAAILAGLGIGVFESLEAGQKQFQKSARPVAPDKTYGQFYDDNFTVYQALTQIELLKAG